MPLVSLVSPIKEKEEYKCPRAVAGPVGFEPTIFGSLHSMGVGARCPILVVLAGTCFGRPRSRLRSRLALCREGMIKLVMEAQRCDQHRKSGHCKFDVPRML